ncbi:multisubunit sodium/proton antiporter MrpB subunit [Streptomyces sp. 2333.5]|uniref:MnhB domain-containing protein n=1 Tax=unclassified Streptomyces TaxID=2593676 RepID=UPI000896ADE8|nr:MULTISPECIES: MnhB domain-containing protein [unclassified Streptomyces]PJJ05850.1 multisubunit sodium/proton antiporter MrpB subunit [Streptomyces sp. 2333.5]SEE85655.1 multisubunit sodium/proton antiporter, MrpB subunit [Streptomyces sp. 2314.4]SEF04628.1 multisubunit sodium/proton antiporter, MrpB subunit [Streptomyces sp. 2112.2]
MNGRVRLWVLATGGLGVAVLFVLACWELPGFGGSWHPYGARAVHAALARHTANTISSVNFDQRAFDTLGEESILFGSVVGTVVLLRQTREENRLPPEPARVASPVRRYALLALPVTLLIGLYVVAHGQLSPGGGFQGGVVVATALHLLYIAVDYRALERIRPVGMYEVADAAGEAAYLLVGAAALVTGAAFLTNFLPYGTFNTLSSGGTVPVLNAAIGVEVACGVVVLLARFLDQAVEIEGAERDDEAGAGT